MDLISGPAHNFVPVYQNTYASSFSSQSCNIPSPACQKAPAVTERQILPKVGQTRCYWALLTSSLQFTVLDPVLRYHLQEQAACILDCGLLDFVHPDERESARRDLGNVLAERTLHGSVTRVRYCRLSHVRRLLGWSDDSLPYPPSFPAELIAVDAEYMAVYLVVNCVADGVVLCFIHAVVDIAPQADNDELHKTGWSNWCSTYGFDQEQAHALYQRLCEIAMPVARDIGDQSLRVLQIFRNRPDRPLVLSWPPDSVLFQEGFALPVADSLARLAQCAHLGYAGNTGTNNDARTSCTRRYKSVQSISLQTVGGLKIVQVESILIPHGTIIFACHKVNGAYSETVHACSSFPNSQDRQSEQHHDIDLREMGNTRNHLMVTSHQGSSSQNYVRQWVDQQSQEQACQDTDTWSDQRAIQPSIPSGSNAYYQFNFAVASFPRTQQHDGSGTVDKHHVVSAIVRDSGAEISTAANSGSRSDSTGALAPPTTVIASSAVHRTTREPSSSSLDAETTPDLIKDRGSRQRTSSSGRGQGSPPTGVVSCAHCQITHSPEWRKGPSGKKDLCNACGLRYSRSRAKREGIVSRKRKHKEKEIPPLSRQSAVIRNAHFKSSCSAAPYAHSDVRTAEDGAVQQSEELRKAKGIQPPVSVPQTRFRSGAELRSDGHPTSFGFVETSHSVQIPYFS